MELCSMSFSGAVAFCAAHEQDLLSSLWHMHCFREQCNFNVHCNEFMMCPEQ